MTCFLLMQNSKILVAEGNNDVTIEVHVYLTQVLMGCLQMPTSVALVVRMFRAYYIVYFSPTLRDAAGSLMVIPLKVHHTTPFRKIMIPMLLAADRCGCTVCFWLHHILLWHFDDVQGLLSNTPECLNSPSTLADSCSSAFPSGLWLRSINFRSSHRLLIWPISSTTPSGPI